MPPISKKVDVSTSPLFEGMRLSNVELKPIEDEQERALRLHKEKYSFYFKDMATYML